MVDEVWSGCGTTNTSANSCVDIKADVTRYVNKIEEKSGWVMVGHRTEFLPLPKYTKVMLLAHKNGKTFFRVQDGAHNGKICYMSQANVTEYLGKIAPKKTPAELVVTYGKYVPDWESNARGGEKLEQQLATATIDGVSVKVTMNSIWEGNLKYEWKNYYPIPPGTYTIKVPEAPHRVALTRDYRDFDKRLQHHQVWFQIVYGDNSRFVHVGHASAGCTTVVELEKWADIQEALISHRPGGDVLGKMIVKGKPERTK
jgi:hypothetical protein